MQATVRRYEGVDETRGTVKWFNEASGFGFIVPDRGGQDLFVHRASIGDELRLTMATGVRVEFVPRQGGMGPEAINVVGTAHQEKRFIDADASGHCAMTPVRYGTEGSGAAGAWEDDGGRSVAEAPAPSDVP